MNIGIPLERRPFEYRVGLPPAGVTLFREHGHRIYVESTAGQGAGFSDQDYTRAGATVVYSAEEVFTRADLLLKFARPLLDELELMHSGQAIAGFLHLSAARQDKIDLLLRRKIASLAYDQIVEPDGYRPVVAPLSQVGGHMVVQIAALLLQTNNGGRGILLGGVAGVPAAEVVIIGAGIVGSTAASSFAAAGAHVTVLDVDLRRLRDLQTRTREPLVTLLSTPHNLARVTAYADLVVGAARVPGQRAPIVVTRDMVRGMRPRSLIIDMSIDEGGCVETSRPTTYSSPIYTDEGIIHFCVPNMSGVLGRTATHALFSGAYTYLEAIARLGLEQAVATLPALEQGICTLNGEIRNLTRLKPGGGGGL